MCCETFSYSIAWLPKRSCDGKNDDVRSDNYVPKKADVGPWWSQWGKLSFQPFLV